MSYRKYVRTGASVKRVNSERFTAAYEQSELWLINTALVRTVSRDLDSFAPFAPVSAILQLLKIDAERILSRTGKPEYILSHQSQRK